MIKNNSVNVLIVTYGDRRQLLKNTVNSVIDSLGASIASMVIVQNGVTYNMHEFLADFVKISKKIHVLTNQDNLGSAGGFGKGVEFLHSHIKRDDFVLILDDDCQLTSESVVNLNRLNLDSLEDKFGQFAVSMYRPAHDQDSTKFNRDWDYSHEYYKNTVNRFSVLHRFNPSIGKHKRIDKNICELFCCPYSGLLMSAGIFNDSPAINQDYFLYDDDLRFTAQLSMSGVKILSFKSIMIMDTDRSWYQDKLGKVEKRATTELLLTTDNNDSKIRAFYQIRNGVKTSTDLYRENNLIFFINLVSFVIFPVFKIGILSPFKFARYRLFIRAVVDGLRGRLGKENLY